MALDVLPVVFLFCPALAAFFGALLTGFARVVFERDLGLLLALFTLPALLSGEGLAFFLATGFSLSLSSSAKLSDDDDDDDDDDAEEKSSTPSSPPPK